MGYTHGYNMWLRRARLRRPSQGEGDFKFVERYCVWTLGFGDSHFQNADA